MLCEPLVLCNLLPHLDYLIPGHLKKQRSLGLSVSMWPDITCVTGDKIPQVMFSEVAH